MKNLRTAAALIVLTMVIFFTACKKEVIVEPTSTFVGGSAALVASTMDSTGTMTIQVKVQNIQPDQEVWAEINNQQKILGDLGNGMYGRTFEVDPYGFPDGDYMANIRIQDKNSGQKFAKIQTNLANINWNNSGGGSGGGSGSDTVEVVIYDSIYVVNNDTFYITVTDTVTVAEPSILITQFFPGNIATNGFNYSVDVSTNFMNSVDCEIRIVQNGSNTVLHTEPFTTSMGGGIVGVNGMFGSGNPNTNYRIQIFVVGESTPFFESNVQTLEVGASQFTFTGVTNIGPNGFTVNYIKTNTSNQPITVGVRDFVGSDESFNVITMNPGDIHVTGSFSVSGYSQNTMVSFEAMINGGIVDNGNEYTDFITYSAIQNLNGAGSTGLQNVLPSQDLIYFTFKFTSNGEATGNDLNIYFQSDSLTSWTYINTQYGLTYSAMPASLPGHWVNLGSGLYKFAVANANIPINNGVNNVFLSMVSDNYANNGSYPFAVYAEITDEAGNTIVDSVNTQTTIF